PFPLLKYQLPTLSTSVSSDSSAVKCDSVYSCPDGNTCCRQITGHWSCCPHPQTVCCFAGTRCCPKDYTSGVSTSSRAMNGLSIPLVSMISAVESALSTSVSSDSSAVKCDSVFAYICVLSGMDPSCHYHQPLVISLNLHKYL
uniref:Granulins domain-containing protein n=1 Tax=Callorhinchus milii TaxID=7868 RepID=A0A4W3JC86_CALMI